MSPDDKKTNSKQAVCCILYTVNGCAWLVYSPKEKRRGKKVAVGEVMKEGGMKGVVVI